MVHQELAKFINYLSDEEYPQGQVEYHVRLVGGADYRPFFQYGEDGNPELAQRRGEAVRQQMKRLLESPSTRHLQMLKTKVDDARVNQIAIQYRLEQSVQDEIVRLRELWPASEVNGSSKVGDIDDRLRLPWRAAAVYIERRIPDDVSAITMNMVLAKTTTFADMLYFSFVSFTTTGYGDIQAVSYEARFWVILENILEIIFAAVFFVTAMRDT
jgi:hypothetical protein